MFSISSNKCDSKYKLLTISKTSKAPQPPQPFWLLSAFCPILACPLLLGIRFLRQFSKATRISSQIGSKKHPNAIPPFFLLNFWVCPEILEVQARGIFDQISEIQRKTHSEILQTSHTKKCNEYYIIFIYIYIYLCVCHVMYSMRKSFTIPAEAMPSWRPRSSARPRRRPIQV